MLTIDASVWINAAAPQEPGSAMSREYLRKVSGAKLLVIVPTLLRVEMAASISRTGKNAAKVLDLTAIMTSLAFVQWISLDGLLADKAVAFATTYKLRGADAVYAAVASEHGCKLVSLDKEHLALPSTAIEVLTPRQAMAVL